MMMTMATKLNVFLLFVVGLFSASSGFVNPRNPCHEKRSLGDGSTCEVPIIPPRLCLSCRLKPTDAGGKFKECDNIYNLTAPECKEQFQKYAALNPCDPLRQQQVADYENNIKALDFFVYAVCEECCDCITVGAKVNEYWKRKKSNTLFDVEGRANCGTHAAVDICKVLPNIKTVVNYKSAMPHPNVIAELPKICPPLKDWRNGRSQLPEEEQELVPEFAHEFLRNYTHAARCFKKSLWQSCVRLESDQNRV